MYVRVQSTPSVRYACMQARPRWALELWTDPLGQKQASPQLVTVGMVSVFGAAVHVLARHRQRIPGGDRPGRRSRRWPCCWSATGERANEGGCNTAAE